MVMSQHVLLIVACTTMSLCLARTLTTEHPTSFGIFPPDAKLTLKSKVNNVRKEAVSLPYDPDHPHQVMHEAVSLPYDPDHPHQVMHEAVSLPYDPDHPRQVMHEAVSLPYDPDHPRQVMHEAVSLPYDPDLPPRQVTH